MTAPRVSIVMSVYNNVRDLPKSVASIQAQTLQAWELILVDDGSTDGSSELMDRMAAEDRRIRVMHQANTGLGPALHNGSVTANGQFIARQDADDWSEPTRFERQADFMERRRELVLCGTWTWFHHPQFGRQYALRTPDDDATLRGLLTDGVNPFVHGSCMFRAEAYRKTEGYRFRRFCEEYDLWLRFSQFGKLGIVESEQYNYLISPGGMTFNNAHLVAKIDALTLQLHRERVAGGREATNWREAQERILAGSRTAISSEERETIDLYMHGMRCLKRRRYEECLEFIRKAARGSGPCMASAHRLSWISSVPKVFRHTCLSLMRTLAYWRNGSRLETFTYYEP